MDLTDKKNTERELKFFCKDCKIELFDGIKDTCYCETCGVSICEDCAVKRKFKCRECFEAKYKM